MRASMPSSVWKTAFAAWRNDRMTLRTRIENLEMRSASLRARIDEQTAERLFQQSPYREHWTPLPRPEDMAVILADCCEMHGRTKLEELGCGFDFDRWLGIFAGLTPEEVTRYRGVAEYRKQRRLFPFNGDAA